MIKPVKLELLYFGRGNAKLSSHVATFSLPAGYSCPGALTCLAKFDRDKKKLVDGPHQKHRCFHASLEAAFGNVRHNVYENFQMLKQAKTQENMRRLIEASLPASRMKQVRVHVGGDFFNANYFRAWMQVAKNNPHRNFYAYTTSLNIWVANMHEIPENFTLVASTGGKFDRLIKKYDLRNSVVVYHPEQAEKLGLEIDHDDSHAMDPSVKKFALLIHGMQPKGSDSSKAIKRLKQENIEYSYSK